MNQPSDNILCVRLPNWPIQRLVAASSELRKTQVILYRNQPGRGQMVTAVSPAAELSGARLGMPLSEARSLVGRSLNFRDYHVFQHTPEADLRALQQLAMECQQFSPIVGLEENQPPASILLDISGLTHLFAGPDGLRARIHRHFQSLGYLVATAIAPTIGQAWGLARFARDDAGDFEALPTSALRLQENTVDTLAQLGVTKVFQIRSLPRTGLRSRFGDEIIWRLDQADGKVKEVINAIYPPADYMAEKFLDYPVTDRETIQVVVSQLARQLCQQMKGSGRGGLVWRFELNGPLEDAGDQENRFHFTVKLFRPVASLKQLMPLVKMQMESLFRRRSNRSADSKGGKRKLQLCDFQVQEVIVSVRNCVKLAERQRQLFDENPRLDQQALAHLVNRLGSRLGAENVLRPVLQSGAQAEDSCFFEPLVGQTQTRKRRRSRAGEAISPLQRPLVLYPHPIPVQFVLGQSHARLESNPGSSARATLVLNDRHYQVVRRWGPERIETAWWRGPTVRRDYWRVETETNRWWWVYRDLRKNRWFLHGEF